jgi:hypothetical protein
VSLGESFFEEATAERKPGTKVAEDLEDELWQAIRKRAATDPQTTEELVDKCQGIMAGLINGEVES